ncbi:MAG: Smr/MutS family protein [Candidatus Wallbacteria bacterium]
MESYKKSLEFDKVLEKIARYVRTESGRSCLMNIEQCGDIESIYKRFSLIAEIQGIIAFEGRFDFEDLFDFRDECKRLKIMGYFMDAVSLYKFSKMLFALSQIKSAIFKYREKYRVLNQFTYEMQSFNKLSFRISRCVDSEGFVKDEASSKLASIRNEISTLSGRIQGKLKDLINKLKAHVTMSEDYVTMREGRFVIPMPSAEKGRVKGIVHDYSQSRMTSFVEPVMVLNENNRLRELKENEAAEVIRIIAELNDAVRPEASAVLMSLNKAYWLDAYCAIAAFADEKKCERVKVQETGELEIINGRHPLLGADCVPLNIKLSKDNDILILSGPNAGGKTVLLKTIGLFCLMAKTGIPVPADAATALPLIDKMFVDIGDSQSITENLSTFSGHIKFLSEMVAGISEPRKTLVLLDELGSGSAPNYSAAIACSIIWHLANIKTHAIITTHFSKVVDFAYSLDNAVNGSLEFDINTLKPTYRLIMGIPGASYAIHIAKNYGLPQFLIEKASGFLDENEVRYEELISELIRYSSDLKREYKNVMDETQKLRKSETKVIDLEKAFSKTRAEIEYELRDEYERKYNEMLKKVNNALNVKKQESDLKEIKQNLTREIVSEKKNLSALEQDEKPQTEKRDERLLTPGFPYRPGDSLLIEKFNASVILKEINFKKRQALVEFKNKMQMWVKFSLISGTSENLSEFDDRSVISYKPAEYEITHELDIRGKTCDAGIEALETYLARAAERHLKTVRIVHGKGTLALKAAVESYLKTEHSVKSFRTGKYGEGDYGVTVVELE